MTITEMEVVVIPRHRVLREVIRKYLTLKRACEEDGNYTLEVCRIVGCINTPSVRFREIEDELGIKEEDAPDGAGRGHSGRCIPVSINLLDLAGCLKPLSKRKKEAMYYNVIQDMKQKDVAAIMGITTVSVGQYVEQACLQIEKIIWPGEDS